MTNIIISLWNNRNISKVHSTKVLKMPHTFLSLKTIQQQSSAFSWYWAVASAVAQCPLVQLQYDQSKSMVLLMLKGSILIIVVCKFPTVRESSNISWSLPPGIVLSPKKWISSWPPSNTYWRQKVLSQPYCKYIKIMRSEQEPPYPSVCDIFISIALERCSWCHSSIG